MQKIGTVLLSLFSISILFAQSDDSPFTSESSFGFEMAFSENANMSNWSISYTGQDSLSAGFFLDGVNKRRGAWPSLSLRSKLDFGKLFIPFELGFSVSRDKNRFYSIGLGYEYIIERPGLDVGFQMSATYTYQNLALRAGVVNVPNNRELVVEEQNFIRDKVVVSVGNRVHQVRPRVGISIGNDDFSILLEGWYGAPISTEERVFVRGQTIFPRRTSIELGDPQLEVRDALGNALVDWDFSQQFGLSLVLTSHLN